MSGRSSSHLCLSPYVGEKKEKMLDKEGIDNRQLRQTSSLLLYGTMQACYDRETLQQINVIFSE